MHNVRIAFTTQIFSYIYIYMYIYIYILIQLLQVID